VNQVGQKTATVAYGGSANLIWTSTNATTCYAGSDWTGQRGTANTESTGPLTTVKTYTYTLYCTGSGGTSQTDSVTVIVQAQQTMLVILEPLPNTGTAPLTGVDLRATVTGLASGNITYKFDCTSDGSWDFQTTIDGFQYTATDLCSYNSAGQYRAKVQIQRGNLTIEGVSWVVVSTASSNPTQPICRLAAPAQ
jgi:hypothetical protein